jgi:ABC-type dipeptide/oligopeptide/nickel transport system permease component
LPVIWLVVSIVFLLIHLVPGDPIQQMLGEGAPVADVKALRHDYGFDAPLRVQYFRYWKGVLHGDLGRSIRYNQTVVNLLAQRYPYTLRLTLASLLVAIILSIPAGVRSARRRNRWDDRLLSVISLFGLSFPNFALGPILILLFAIKLGWLPVSGAGSFASLVLPAFTMGSALAAILTRMVRTSMLEELSQDYIRTARAKGLPERTVVYRHALRNAMIPVLTVLGLQFGALLAGAIVTEKIFSWPGIGRLTIDAISSRDYYVVQGCILAIGLTYVAVNFLTDVLYSVANPRIRQ